MPFRSEKQRRWMWANHPKMARRWAAHTPRGKKLPKRAHRKDESVNESRVDPGSLSPEYQYALDSLLNWFGHDIFASLTRRGEIQLFLNRGQLSMMLRLRGGETQIYRWDGEEWQDSPIVPVPSMSETFGPRRLVEVSPKDDPELDPDEREEMESQLAGYELEPGDDAPEEPVGEPVEISDIDRRRQAMMDALADEDYEEAEEPAAPEEMPGPAAAPSQPLSRKSNRPKEYSRRSKELATRDPSLYAMEHQRAREDIADYADEIEELHDEGNAFGAIARIINDRHGLSTSPSGQDKKSGPGARSLRSLRCPECGGPIERTQSSFICPECGHQEVRALTPEQVADYLKFAGLIRRGPASSFQDLGSQMEHDHDPDEWREDCPACNWSAGVSTEEGDDSDLREMFRMLASGGDGTFTTQEAIQTALSMPRFEADIRTPYFDPCPQCGDTRRVKTREGELACRGCRTRFDVETAEPRFYQTHGYSDTRLPKDVRNMADLVIRTLKSSPEFEPADPDWAQKMWTTRPLQVSWRLADEDDELSESVVKPPGATPFQNWEHLGQFGTQLKQQADLMDGQAYENDGQLVFYPTQMGLDDSPMVADLSSGNWTSVMSGDSSNESQASQRSSTAYPSSVSNQAQTQPQMSEVFEHKG